MSAVNKRRRIRDRATAAGPSSIECAGMKEQDEQQRPRMQSGKTEQQTNAAYIEAGREEEGRALALGALHPHATALRSTRGRSNTTGSSIGLQHRCESRHNRSQTKRMSIGNGDEWLESKTRLHRTDTTHHHNTTNRDAKRAEAAIHTMSPARRALMAKPRPVPPNTRVVDTSA